MWALPSCLQILFLIRSGGPSDFEVIYPLFFLKKNNLPCEDGVFIAIQLKSCN